MLGHNGSGKSTLLKIMAGIDTEFNGEAWAADGVTVGYLAQEPQLDPRRTCSATSWKASAPPRSCSRISRRSPTRWPIPMPISTRCSPARRNSQEKIDAADAWDIQRTVEIAMDALRCPPGDADVTKLLGR